MRERLRQYRSFFIYTGLFSFVVELLLLTPVIFMVQIFNRVIVSRSLETLVMLSIIVVVALLLDAFLEVIRSRLLLRAGVTLQQHLGQPVLTALLRIRKQGMPYQHGLEDLGVLQNFITGTGIKAFFDLPWIPLYLLILYFFHPVLCLIAFGGAAILFLLTFVDEKLTAKNQLAANSAVRQGNAFAHQAQRNAEIVAALAMQEEVGQRWRRVNDDYLQVQQRASSRSITLQAISKFLRYGLQSLSLGVSAYLIIHENLTPGIMIASTIILGRALQPIDKLIASWKIFVSARGAYRRLDTLLAESVPDPAEIDLPQPEGRLTVEHVSFAFLRDRVILNDLHFALTPGESLGIIGANASGKTTLARLLVGLYPPNIGHVRLDGADSHYWAQHGLGRHIGYLPQTVELFDGTVAENIARLGNPKQEVDRIIRAARRAQVHEAILKLPQGYDTVIGEGGSRLSGGQRQLIGLARALFGEPKFVVLDEPNANLDGQAEFALMDTFKQLKAAAVTLIVITHKPSILRHIDKVLVLQNGRQALFGMRDEVLPRLLPGATPGRRQESLTVPGVDTRGTVSMIKPV